MNSFDPEISAALVHDAGLRASPVILGLVQAERPDLAGSIAAARDLDPLQAKWVVIELITAQARAAAASEPGSRARKEAVEIVATFRGLKAQFESAERNRRSRRLMTAGQD